MNQYVTGTVIRELREKRRLTQLQLAEKLGVSDKTVSKWETGKGYPDITLLEPIAEVFGVSVTELISGNAVHNANVSANMLRSKFYVCPVCGNVIHSVGEAAVSCHGIRLEPLEAEKAERCDAPTEADQAEKAEMAERCEVSAEAEKAGRCDAPLEAEKAEKVRKAEPCEGPANSSGTHAACLSRVEDEYYLQLPHSMTKEHYISFAAAVSPDDIQLVKLYPEGPAEARFRIRKVRRIYFYCNRDGLFFLDVLRR